MTFGSLFAGVGGFDLGFERAGLTCAWQVEIDRYCQQVLQAHFPHTEKIHDIRAFEPRGSVDIICGGFPCQDLSVAGRRAGLAGERSALFFGLLRVVDDARPRTVVIENVPGLLSSNGGKDMGTVVGELAKRGYWWAYRVLDSQYFGVPQRRRRVFIVGDTRKRRAAEILALRESLQGPSSSRTAAQEEDSARSGKLLRRDCADMIAFPSRGINSASECGLPQCRVTNPAAIASPAGVRRLTPVEHERLQGFPDGWTAGLSDTRRYRVLGNAVTVNVAEWIGKRIITYVDQSVEAEA